ncbi:MAG: carbonic anhydrase [Rikenellaceae bacterium]
MKRLYAIVAVAMLLVACAGQQKTTELIETPEQAIKALQEGNARFVAGKLQVPNADEARRTETFNKQKPFAVVVGCSDSRVPVEMLFDCGIGDLFVIRTAGNSVADDVVMGSIDYAVDHLGCPLVVILGHQNCGGITSACEPSAEHHHGKIDQLLAVIRQDVEKYVGHPEQLDEAIHANAEEQVKRIKREKYLADKFKQNKLQVISAYYHLDTGVVDFDL